MKYPLVFLIVLILFVGVVSADTTIYNASGGSNADGSLRIDGYDTFSSARASAGNGVSLTETTVQVGTWSYSVSDFYGTPVIARYGFCANTSDLADDATITTSTFGLYGYAYGFTLGNTRIGITTFAPTTVTNLVAGDYGKKGTTEYANITNTSWTNSGYNNFTLNNNTIVNKTGHTCLMARTGWDIAGSGLTWSSSKNTYYRFYETSQTGTDKDPFLQIEWTAAGGSAPVAAFTTAKSLYRIPGILQVNDTSTNTPTGWNWSWGDGTWTNGTTQNATHKYTTRGTKSVYLLCSNVDGSNTSASQNVRIVGYENTW